MSKTRWLKLNLRSTKAFPTDYFSDIVEQCKMSMLYLAAIPSILYDTGRPATVLRTTL